MFHHVDSKNKTIHIYVFFYIIFSSQANLGQLMMYVMTQHLTDSHFVTYNFCYHAMVFNLSWDHPRSNTLYSDLSLYLSWDHPRSNTLYSDLSLYLSWDHPRSNTLYSNLSLYLSWDHPRSNTLYSNLSWDVLLLLYLGSSKVQYPVLQVTTNKLIALPNLLWW